MRWFFSRIDDQWLEARGQQHGYRFLIQSIGLAETGDQIPLLHGGADDDPDGPEPIVQQSIHGKNRAGPDDDQAEQIEGMAHPAVGAAIGERIGRW